MSDDEGMAMHQAAGSWEHEASLPAGLLEAVAQALFGAAEKTPGARIPVIAVRLTTHEKGLIPGRLGLTMIFGRP